MTSPWARPDPRPAAGGTLWATPPPSTSPPWWKDVWAGLLTVAVTVLVGAPVGLLWSALAPHVRVDIVSSDVEIVGGPGDSFIAVDGYYLAAVVLAGLVGGAAASWRGAAHGPAVVLGLTVGGVAAAWVAMVVGGLVGDTPVADLVASGVEGRQELAVELRATSALLGWPIASLLSCLALTLRRRA